MTQRCLTAPEMAPPTHVRKVISPVSTGGRGKLVHHRFCNLGADSTVFGQNESRGGLEMTSHGHPRPQMRLMLRGRAVIGTGTT